MDKDTDPSGPNEEARADVRIEDTATAGNGWREPAIDLVKYLPHLDTIDASDADKIELLETLCAILRACIELQLSGDTYIELIDALESASQESGDPLSSKDQ